MVTTVHWENNYAKKKRTGKEAIGFIRHGQRVFIGSSCGEPQHLVRELAEAYANFKNIEIVRILTLETTPLTLIAKKTKGQRLDIRSFDLGSAKAKGLERN